jgi:hypothetical protein
MVVDAVKDPAAAPGCSHRDLVAGRCTVEEYVTELKARVDARLASERVARQARLRAVMRAERSLGRAEGLLRSLRGR